jgi:hypothetical protein
MIENKCETKGESLTVVIVLLLQAISSSKETHVLDISFLLKFYSMAELPDLFI